MTDKAAERLLSGKAWDDFCEQVRLAGHMVDRFGDSAPAADGFRHFGFTVDNVVATVNAVIAEGKRK